MWFGFHLVCRAVLLLAMIASPAQADETVAEAKPMRCASRTEGPAPLGVFFDATVPSSLVVQPGDIARAGERDLRFTDLVYEWSFGEEPNQQEDRPGRAYLPYGHVAGHVFRRPGTHEVALRVILPDGTSRQYRQSVKVLAPDDFFPVERTIFVAAGSPDIASGTREHPLGSIEEGVRRLFAMRGPGRLSLRRGGVYKTRGMRLGEFQGPYLIDAWGDGSDPVIHGTTSNPILELGEGEDLTVSGISFRSDYDPGTGRGTHPDVLRLPTTNRYLTIVDNDFANAGLNIFLGQLGACADSVIAGNRITAWQNYGVLTGHLERVAIIQNRIRQSPDAATGDGKNPPEGAADLPDHGPIRIRTADRVVVAGNDLFSNTGWSPGRGGRRAHQPCLRLGTGGFVDLAIVADNDFEGGMLIAREGPWEDDDRPRHGNLWERNRFTATTGTRRFVSTDFDGAVFRNNLFTSRVAGTTLVSTIRFAPLEGDRKALARMPGEVSHNTLDFRGEQSERRAGLVTVERPEMVGLDILNNFVRLDAARSEAPALVTLPVSSCPEWLRSDGNVCASGGQPWTALGDKVLSLHDWQETCDADRRSSVLYAAANSGGDTGGDGRHGSTKEVRCPEKSSFGLPAVRVDLHGRKRTGRPAVGAVE